MFTGPIMTDKYGRMYRHARMDGKLYGRLYEPVQDTRQQPKSLAMRLIEERTKNGK